MRKIHLNFLQFNNQNIGLTVYRKKFQGGEFKEQARYYDLPDSSGINRKYEILDAPTVGYDEYQLPPYLNTGLIATSIYDKLSKIDGLFNNHQAEKAFSKKLYYVIESHAKGQKCVWIEPFFLKTKKIWGISVGYRFLVDDRLKVNGKVKLDREILIASGALNTKGLSNQDFYLFKHDFIVRFIKTKLPAINNATGYQISNQLSQLEGELLKPKNYIFHNSATNSSPYLGIIQNAPLRNINGELNFLFIYKKEDRDFAATLLKGLRGETHPNTFSGIQKMFRVPFTNDKIRGVSVVDFSDNTLDEQINEIKTSKKQTLPIIVIPTRKDDENEHLYFRIKHTFTNAGIPVQVVTKELIANDYSIKYSLGNIALQIFAKAGGTPWKMKPATTEYLIIGVGQSYNIEKTPEGHSIEKNITYSVLTDSSGIFKDLQVLSEGVEVNDSYYTKLATNISEIINKSGYKRVAIHAPFRISKDRILEKVTSAINTDTELSVLVINDKTDHFGFDYSNNGLVPFESTFIKLAANDYLVWFEGLSFNNPKITKRFANPLLISFWYTNKPALFQSHEYKESLLQDCINLSGANWRGFKAKQLPVSIFYCQRIAEFIGKFREYNLDHIEINNLKPWFL